MTTPKEALERALEYLDGDSPMHSRGGHRNEVLRVEIRQALASLEGDAVERVARAAQAVHPDVSALRAIEEAARLASLHAHHALWHGLLPYGWDSATEQFGRNLANSIAKAIKAELPKRLALAATSSREVSEDELAGKIPCRCYSYTMRKMVSR